MMKMSSEVFTIQLCTTTEVCLDRLLMYIKKLLPKFHHYQYPAAEFECNAIGKLREIIVEINCVGLVLQLLLNYMVSLAYYVEGVHHP